MSNGKFLPNNVYMLYIYSPNNSRLLKQTALIQLDLNNKNVGDLRLFAKFHSNTRVAFRYFVDILKKYIISR